MSGIEWRRTTLTRDLIRCDLCGKRADTMHFHTEGEYPDPAASRVGVAFACPQHDAGGYHLYLQEWFENRQHVEQHIEQKTWGPAALSGLSTRIDQVLREAADRDGEQRA